MAWIANGLRNIHSPRQKALFRYWWLPLVLSSILLPTIVLAQGDLSNVLGIPPDAAIYPIPGLGFVNLNNGNLHVEIPLRVVQERNGTTMETSITYDNSVYRVNQQPGQNGYGGQQYWAVALPQSEGYWSSSLGISTQPNYLTQVLYQNPNYQCGNSSIPQYLGWQFIDGHGTVHEFPPALVTERGTGTPCPDTPNGQASATDGSGYWINITNYSNATVYDIHGNEVAGGAVDVNGNFPHSSVSNFPDMLGRSAFLPSGYGLGTETIHVWTNFGVSSILELGPISGSAPSSLTLPDGRTYLFQYDDAGNPAQQGHYGSLTGITLPTGGQISISSEVLPYQGTAMNFVVRQITTPDGTWNFSYSSGLVTATAPPDLHTGLSSQTTCAGGNGVTQTVSIYSGAATGTPLRTVTTQYSDYRPTSVSTTLENGQSSHVAYTYADQCTPRVATKKEYDYSGSLLRETDATYLTSASDNTNLCAVFGSTPPSWNSTYLQNNHHIADIPSSITVYGSGGCCSSPVAQTNYTYDSTALSTTSGPSGTGTSVLGLPIHDDTNFGSSMTTRGNPTVVSQMKSPGSFITTETNYYNILGELVKKVDGNSNATSFDFTDNWNDSSCISAPVFGYPTSVTNALGQLTKTTYNSCDGSVASTRNQNDLNASRNGTVYLYDGLQRVTNVALPDGGNRQTIYTDSPLPAVVTTITNITSGLQETGTKTLDGMGRTIQTALTSDPDGTTYTATAYDPLGRVGTVYNPTRCNPPTSNCGESTWGATTYTYDALGRPTSVLEPDNSSVSTKYAGNCTTVTDEAAKVRKTCSDSRGRLIEVDEPGAGGNATSGSGTVTIAGPGEQSFTAPATPSTGSFSISGTESYETYNCGGPPGCQIYNSGNVTITINATPYTWSYSGCQYGGEGNIDDPGNTSSGIASKLAGLITNDPNAVVTITSISGSTVNFKSKGTGTTVNYSLSSSSAETCSPSGYQGLHPFPGPDFTISSASSMTGGMGAQPPVYDSGSVSINVNGVVASVNYGQNDSATTVATALTNAINVNPSSPATATSSGGLVTLTATSTGYASDYPLSTSVSWNTQYFSQASFQPTPSGGTLTGGQPTNLGPNPLVTLYSYDPLDDLTCAVQKGTDTTAFTTCAAASATWRPRSFGYDSLSRLTSATNPESGSIAYAYDNDGNVLSKTAPKPSQTGSATVVTSYSYDALNRLTQKGYNDGSTATVKYGFDGTALSGCTTTPPALTDSNPKGYATAMCDGSGATSWKHDPMGRTLGENRTILSTSAVTRSFAYTYNLDGSMATLAYPNTGRVITYTPGGAGRMLAAQDLGGPIYYVQNAHYAPFGGLTSMTNGTAPITTTNTYNSRLQPISFAASKGSTSILSLTYDFHLGAGDNGNVFQIANGRDNNRTQNFIYDPLNRIQQANTTGPNWGETFTIDNWGNLTNRGPVSGKTNYEGLSSAALTNNRLTGYGYDAAGNMTSNGTASYTYDAENRITTTAGVTYTYDGNGGRVKKSGSLLYWTGTGSDTLSESNLGGTVQSEYIFFNGKRVGRHDIGGVVRYYFSDHLGSASVVTDYIGTMPPLKESDYYPYGGEIPISGSDANRYKFTGKERDSESGLDNFGARYNASSIGRMMSPDPSNVSVDFWMPQTWNRYSYALNNPLKIVDRNGLWPTDIHNEIIDQAFPGLSQGDRLDLKEASYDTDYYNRVDGHDPQDPEVSYVHGMSDGVNNQDPAQAQQEGDTFIAQNEHDAQEIQAEWVAEGNSGIAPAALTAFGNALHTIEDRTSPAHAGNQPWYGTKGLKNKYRALQHVRREETINSAQMNGSVAAARRAFRQTFGDEFEWLVQQHQPKACVEVDDGLGNRSKSCD